MQIDIMPSLIAGSQPLRSRKSPKVIPLPKIVVRDPVIHDSWEQGKYATFQICIRTNHPAFHLRVSTVRRRFSELIWLNNLLREKNQGASSLPLPPPKRIFSDRFNQNFLRSRMKEMQKYFNKLVQVDEVLSDNAFHLFIQTDLTTTELNEYFDGKLPEGIIADAWANMGHMHSNSLLSKPLPPEPQEIVMNEEDTTSSSDDSGSGSATPRYSPNTTTTTTTTNSDNNNINDQDSAITMSSDSTGNKSMTELGLL